MSSSLKVTNKNMSINSRTYLVFGEVLGNDINENIFFQWDKHEWIETVLCVIP